MLVKELIERLREFDDSLPVEFIGVRGGEIVTHPLRFADLPEHESFVLLHDYDEIEGEDVWTQGRPTPAPTTATVAIEPDWQARLQAAVDPEDGSNDDEHDLLIEFANALGLDPHPAA